MTSFSVTLFIIKVVITIILEFFYFTVQLGKLATSYSWF